MVELQWSGIHLPDSRCCVRGCVGMRGGTVDVVGQEVRSWGSSVVRGDRGAEIDGEGYRSEESSSGTQASSTSP
jgi:hypothetical protein